MARVIIVKYQRAPQTRREASPIARHAVAALLLSNGIRRDTSFIAFFEHENATLRLEGGRLRNLRADEESATGLIWSLLKNKLSNTPPPKPATCAYSGGENIMCPNPTRLCEKLESPILVNPSNSMRDSHCEKTVQLPPSPSIMHRIILLNMVLDQCSHNPL